MENQARQAADERRQKQIRDEKFQRIYQSVEHAQAVITRQNPSGGRLLKKKDARCQVNWTPFEREDEKHDCHARGGDRDLL